MHANGMPPRRLAARVRVHLLAGLAGLLVLLGLSSCMGDATPTRGTSDAAPSQPAAAAPGHTAGMVGSIGAHTSSPSMTGNAPDRAGNGPEPADAVAIVGGRTITRSALIERLWKGYGIEVLREMMLREAVLLEAAAVGDKGDG